MRLNTVKALLIKTAKDYNRDNCTTLAAAIAYYSIFSIFPLLLFFLSILGAFLNDQQLKDQIVNSIVDQIPTVSTSDTNSFIQALNEVASGSSGVVSFIGILLLAWSARKSQLLCGAR
jgi:membrane protein